MKIEQIINSDMLDLIFEGRNKEYGAYDLRRRYRKIMIRTGLIVLGLVILFVGWAFLKDRLKSLDDGPQDVKVELENLLPPPPMDENTPPPPPPPAPPPPPERASVQYVPPVVKEVVKEEVVLATVDDLKEKDPGVKTVEGDPNAKVNINTSTDIAPVFGDAKKVVIEEKEDDNKVFVSVEQKPTFPGGDAELFKWLAENIKYPSEARENGLQGKVIVRFLVEKDGSIKNVELVRDGVGGGAGNEALRVVKKMPNWKAGRQNGKAVRVQFTLPITFKLEE